MLEDTHAHLKDAYDELKSQQLKPSWFGTVVTTTDDTIARVEIVLSDNYFHRKSIKREIVSMLKLKLENFERVE